MPKGRYPCTESYVSLIVLGTGRSKVHHKGRGKKYLTEEEIRIAEDKKTREKEWKVSSTLLLEEFLLPLTI